MISEGLASRMSSAAAAAAESSSSSASSAGMMDRRGSRISDRCIGLDGRGEEKMIKRRSWRWLRADYGDD